MVVCSSALETLRSERSLGRNAFMDQARSNQSIKADITRLLQGKSLNELRALQDSVRAKLSSGDPIDVEYWEGLLKELAVWMSKSKLRTMHEVVLRNRLEHLRRKQRDEAVRVQNELVDEVQARERKREEEEEARAEMLEQRDSLVQEEWDESMAPALVQKVPREDQHLQLVDPVSELVSLVRAAPSSRPIGTMLTTCTCTRSPRAALSRRLASCPRKLDQQTRPKTRPSQRAKRSSRPRRRKGSTRTRRCSTRRASSGRSRTPGRTSTGRGSRGTSTRSSLGSNGTSTIRRTTSMSQHSSVFLLKNTRS